MDRETQRTLDYIEEQRKQAEDSSRRFLERSIRFTKRAMVVIIVIFAVAVIGICLFIQEMVWESILPFIVLVVIYAWLNRRMNKDCSKYSLETDKE